MVLSPALLFLGAKQFCVPVHAVSEGLAALGQGACSLRALLVVAPVCRDHGRPPPPMGIGQHWAGVSISLWPRWPRTPGSDLCIPQDPAPSACVSSPESLPCEPVSSL